MSHIWPARSSLRVSMVSDFLLTCMQSTFLFCLFTDLLRFLIVQYLQDNISAFLSVFQVLLVVFS